MKLNSMLLESSKNNHLEAFAQEAQDAYDNGNYELCGALIARYEAGRAAGEEPGQPATDGWMEELKNDLEAELSPSSSSGGSSSGDYSDYDDYDDDDGYSGYDNRAENLEADSDDYIDPDSFYHRGSRTVIYAENGELVVELYPTTHTDLVSSRAVRRKLFAGTEYEDEAANGDWGHQRSYLNAQQYCLLGRIDPPAQAVSFWNMDADQVERLLAPCVARLMEGGHITPDTLVMAPPLDRSVPAGEVESAQTQEVSPEAQERLRLQQRLHLAVGAEKEAIRRKLGIAAVPGKPHPMATAMRQAGRLSPGQKWWAGTSEDFQRRLSRVLG